MFHFKHFSVRQSASAMKVGTDAMILGALIDSSKKKRGLDIGAGTGVLSLMVAQLNPTIQIDAVEIDELAAEECALNFKNSSWLDRLSVFQEDFDNFNKENKYDLIFSNPPYYATTNLNEDSRKAQARHEDSLPSSVILKKVNSLLSVEGEFWVIIPFSEQDKWISLGASNNLFVKTIYSIKGKSNKEVNRVVLCFNRSVILHEENEMVVRKLDNSYSDEYIELTKEFHSIDLRK